MDNDEQVRIKFVLKMEKRTKNDSTEINNQAWIGNPDRDNLSNPISVLELQEDLHIHS